MKVFHRGTPVRFAVIAAIALCAMSTAEILHAQTTACLQQVQIQAGTAVTFISDTPLASGTDANPVWTATIGAISQTGVYIAPTTTPPDGVDMVTYTDPSTGAVTSIPILIVANAGAAMDPNAPVLSLDDPSVIDPSSSVDTSALVDPSTFGSGTMTVCTVTSTTSSASSVRRGGNLHASTSSLATTSTGSDVTTISPLIIQGQTAYPVPTIESMMNVYMVAAYQPTQTCRKRLYPPPPYNCKSCTAGSPPQLVWGPDNITQNSGVFNYTITVTADMSATIWQVFGIKVSVGAKIPASVTKTTYREWRNADIYECVNGVWTYVGSQQCSRVGTNLSGFQPSWSGLIIYGTRQDPTPIQWNVWTCHRI